MSRRSRLLLIAMSTASGIAALGLIIGMFYNLYLVSIRHVQLENALGTSIVYNKILGGFGILGMLFFFGFCPVFCRRLRKARRRRRKAFREFQIHQEFYCTRCWFPAHFPAAHVGWIQDISYRTSR